MKIKFETAKSKLKTRLLDLRSVDRYVDKLRIKEYKDSEIKRIIRAIEESDRIYFSNLLNEKGLDTVLNLRLKAKKLGILNYANLNKKQLLKIIEELQNE